MTAKWILLITFLSLPVHGHVGDRVIPIFEITDNELAQFDLKDGSTEDWENFGEASLTILDFDAYTTAGELVGRQFDPADLDFRVWLAWNATQKRIYVAGQFVDDAYVGVGETDTGAADHLAFDVDADHSGGRHFYFSGETQLHLQHAQRYRVPANVVPEDPVEISWGPLSRSDWMIHPPYADGGWGLVGENPLFWVLEFYVTPFDELIWDDPEGSVISRLDVGTVIGLQVWVMDVDTTAGEFELYLIHDGVPGAGDADDFVDGLLIGAGDIPDETAVRSYSWGRIKASLGQ